MSAATARRVRLADTPIDALVASLRPSAEDSESLRGTVADLLAEVREDGDAALVTQAVRFGAADFTEDLIRVEESALTAAADALRPELRRAIEVSAAQVRALASAQLGEDRVVGLEYGQTITLRSVPVDAVGCYVPGGRAAYPSSLIMAAVPAQVAGVRRIAVASPPGPDGRVAEVVLGAASLLGIDEVYAIGGAAAIGAFAYGTARVAPVAVITGPGNAWVTEAKRQVLGRVGIDSLAGPSELVVIADHTADAELVASDLLAQAEHGPDSMCVLASVDGSLCDRVDEEIVRVNPEKSGQIVCVECRDLEQALAVSEAIAPEHLQLMVGADARDSLAARVRNAGCVFLGRTGATAFGDYVAGSNHILPTGGAARFASAVGPATFLRRMSVVDLPQRAVTALVPHLAALADAEGFPEHRRSAELRATTGGNVESSG